jgi:transcription-repair coupling factor (superfamily II helicase)
MTRVESMEEFSPDDRTHLIEKLQDRLHFDGIETLAPFFDPLATLLSYLKADAAIVFVSPDDLAKRSEELDHETRRVRRDRLAHGDPVPAAQELMATLEELEREIQSRDRAWLGEIVLPGSAPAPLAPPSDQAALQLKMRAQERGKGEVEKLLRETAALLQKGQEVLLYCGNRGQAERMGELFEEFDPQATLARPRLCVGSLRAGFAWPDAELAIYTDHEFFDRYQRPARRPRFHGSARVKDPKTLHSGDFVVHAEHGIARYLGLRKLTVEEVENEFLLLEYADKDRLYLPTDKLLLLERYEIGESGEPALHRLGSGQWERTRQRARKAIRAMAQELLSLYAARSALPGHPFGEDTHLQQEMEASFLHEETPDQLTAVEAVKKDMESPRPMDRLVCGDVGFGKTEVAMRAAFKAVMGGLQVAILCPTTILAEQHGETFSQRMREFPVRIEVLSRFKSRKEQKETLQRLQKGEIDILVGTHRLLGRDVKFAKLGLLVVDEEQRFGVRHKERLKEMRKQVDVMALSATPIPRTLYLSLMGARDMSIIATPPRDRLPIHTEVVPYQENIIEEAILREMHRGGQVFFVHNRVETIDAMAEVVGRIVPHARIAIAHGQMKEAQLEQIMRDFLARKYDVLVTTMIIESGLDMPNVNTILIDRADRLGLSQLYQLRGRVGRSRHLAYAHLMTPPGTTLAPDARKRLAAIQEYTDLGSGYRIAMRDLEIRGAGNILGEAQHGHIASIGFDLYCKLLEEEILDLKGEGMPRLHDIKVELQLGAYLPDEYLPEPEERIRWYRDLGRVVDEEALDHLAEELRDRFGPPPDPTKNLLDITRIKLRALRAGVEDIRRVRRGVRMLFGGASRPNASILTNLAGTQMPRLAFNAVDRLEMTVEASREDSLVASLVVLEKLAEAGSQSAAKTSPRAHLAGRE